MDLLFGFIKRGVGSEWKKISFSLCLIILSKVLSAQCTGFGFTSTETTICAPGAIDFKISGTQGTDSVVWFIGNEKIAGKKEFTKIFLDKGIFDLVFEVHRNGTLLCRKTEKDYLVIGRAPESILFDYDQSSGCKTEDSITFTGRNKGIISWSWIIDGKNYRDTGNIITHYFSKKGKYDVSIKVIDTLGCEKVENYNSLVKLTGDIEFDFSAGDTEIFAPGETDFFPDVINKNEITSYSWNFEGGDPQSSSLEKPENVKYNNPGVYDVSLKITNEYGCASFLKKADYIRVGIDNNLDFSLKSQMSCKNTPVIVINQSSNKGGKFTWRSPGAKFFGDSVGDTATLIYNSTGYKSVTLVYENNGITKELEKDSFIFIPDLAARFRVKDSCSCTSPHEAKFINKTTLPENGTVSYDWTFFDKDGETILGTSSSQNPSYNYSGFGKYNVRLISEHSSGCVDTFLKEEGVKVIPWIDTIKYDTIFGCNNGMLQITPMPDTLCSMDTILYHWKIYNPGRTSVIEEFTGKDTLISISSEGIYPFEVEMISGQSCQLIGEGVINVLEPRPDFSTSRNVFCTGDTFTLFEKSGPENLLLFHEWKIYESGSIDTFRFKGDKVLASIPEPGLFNVEYKIFTSLGGCEHTVVRKDLLEIGGIMGTVSYVQNNKCLPIKGELTSSIQKNFHPNNPSNTLSYKWRVNPKAGVVIADSLSANTSINISKAGCFSVRLQKHIFS